MSLEAAAVTIRGLLFADVFADLLQLETHRGHRVSTGPEVLAREIPLFATQAGHRYGALPFQKSDHRGHRILPRNRDAHVHMVRQQVSRNCLASAGTVVLSLFSHVVLSVILTEERSLQFHLR